MELYNNFLKVWASSALWIYTFTASFVILAASPTWSLQTDGKIKTFTCHFDKRYCIKNKKGKCICLSPSLSLTHSTSGQWSHCPQSIRSWVIYTTTYWTVRYSEQKRCPYLRHRRFIQVELKPLHNVIKILCMKTHNIFGYPWPVAPVRQETETESGKGLVYFSSVMHRELTVSVSVLKIMFCFVFLHICWN